MLEEKRVEQAALIKEFEERENFLQGLEAQNGRLKEAIEEKRSSIVVSVCEREQSTFGNCILNFRISTITGLLIDLF